MYVSLSDDYIDNKLVNYNQAVCIARVSSASLIVPLFRLPGARLFSDVGAQLLICYINNVVKQFVL
jgi:hypothetical protein